MWFTETDVDQIGRITPAGVVTEFGVGISVGAQPFGIAAGADGSLWFTEQGLARIGRISTAGVVTEFTTGISVGSGPRGIARGTDGDMWFVEATSSRVAHISVVSPFTVTEFVVTPGSVPVDIAVGPDGNMWFTEQAGNRVGRITPTGAFTEFSAGITAGSSPNAITPGPDGNLWFSEAVGNRIARIGSGVDVLVRAPAVYGAGRAGERALCDEGAWKASLDIGSYGIQWTRDGVDLAGATTGVYTPLAGRRRTPARVSRRRQAGERARPLLGAERRDRRRCGGGRPGRGDGRRRRAGRRRQARPTARPAPAERAVRRARRAPPGASGARGAAATAGTAAALLHARLTTLEGKSFTVRYVAGKGTRLVLVVRRRSGQTGSRLAAFTTRKTGRGSLSRTPQARARRVHAGAHGDRRRERARGRHRAPRRQKGADAGAVPLLSVDPGTSGGGLRSPCLTGTSRQAQ